MRPWALGWLGVAVLACALAGCRKKAEPDAAGPKAEWWPLREDVYEVELPARPTDEPPAGKLPEGFAFTRRQVRLGGALFEVGHVEAKGVLEGTQHRKLLADFGDEAVLKGLGGTVVSEAELKVAAGKPGLTWPGRDVVFKAGDGQDCRLREVFAREHLFLLSACARGGVAAEPWARMRDSLKIKLDPLGDVGGVDTSSWAAWSPDGKTSLRQRYAQKGLCTVWCERDAKEVWRAETECQGTAGDAHYVSDDCERSVLFLGTPPRSASLLSAKLIQVFDRTALAYDVVGAALTSKPDTAKRYPLLVKGLGGNEGDKPAYSPDGKSVTFETVEGKKQAVPLAAAPSAQQAPAEAPAAEEDAPAPPPKPKPAAKPKPPKKRHR